LDLAKRKGTPEKDKDSDVLGRARARFERALDGDEHNRRSQRDNTEFVYIPGKQWSDKERAFRQRAEDPCMEFPQLKQFVAQVVNDQRQNRPGIRIHPASGDASKDVAEIIQGLIRGIEYDSRAESVYDCAYQHSVVGGRGYWRVVSEYESPDSFNQKLVIKRIADPSSVLLDPDFEEPDGGDRDFGFVFEDMDIETEFKKRWPKAEAISTDLDERWFPREGKIRVADYYERVCERVGLVMLADGSSVYEDKMPAGAQVLLDEAGKEVRRETERYRIDWYTIAGGSQVLEKHSWPGSLIPVVCAMGDEIVLDGEKIYQGLIDQAKDTQRLFNFGMTQQAIHLALTPRAPYIGTAEAFAGFEPLWKTANTANHAYLPYNARDAENEPLPAPSRQAPSTPDSGWLNWTQQMQMLMKSIIGMYENSLGMKGQERSGVAIRAREQQGDNATFHFLDNFSRAIALTGRIVVECIPTYYDTERIVHIVGEDDIPKLQPINQQQITAGPDGALRAITNGDIKQGKYAVTVEAGPGYATKRQEMAELTMQLVQAYPPLMQFAGDIVVKMQDIPDADQLSERIRAMLPPPIQQILAAKDAGADPKVAQLQTQIQQLGQQLQQMQQQAQAEVQRLAQENQQLKADKSASIEANRAKVMQAQAGIVSDQQHAENERQKYADDAALERDKLMVDLVKALLAQQAQPQQVAVAQQASTEAISANP
jgi:hypothetical protein